MNLDIKRLMKLKEEKQMLERNLNIYYFDREKRNLLFTRLEKIILEIERVENNRKNENRDSNRTQN